MLSFCANANTKIEVLKVYDGDSILAKIENNIFRIRLIDIDCFEGTLNYRVSKQAKEHKLSVNEVVEPLLTEPILLYSPSADVAR